MNQPAPDYLGHTTTQPEVWVDQAQIMPRGTGGWINATSHQYRTARKAGTIRTRTRKVTAWVEHPVTVEPVASPAQSGAMGEGTRQ
jgi:hypothetical protein